MPELRLLPLEETFDAEERSELKAQLAELGVEQLPEADDSVDLDDVLSEEQLTDFSDRLEAHEIACDVYLPVEFEGRIEVNDRSIGSAHALAEALEELRDELDIDEIPADPDEDALDVEMIEEQLVYAWKVFNRATSACISRVMPLHVIG